MVTWSVDNVFVQLNFCLLADGENIDDFLEEFNGDDGYDECELPVYVPRPQSVAKRNQMAIFLNH